MNARAKRWLLHLLFLLLGFVIGVVISYRAGWILSRKGKTSTGEKRSFAAEAQNGAPEEFKSLTASLASVSRHMMPVVVNISSVRVYHTPEDATHP